MAARANPWQGVNPFLNSRLQTPGSDAQPALWHTFHFSFIAALTRRLNQELPEQYVAFSEQSLQLRERGPGSVLPARRPEPDIAIFQQAQAPSPLARQVTILPVLDLSLAEALDTADFLKAVVIREVTDQNTLGRMVTQIELLSPSNKPGGANYAFYRQKRVEAVRSPLSLIEIDLLHETPSPIQRVPVYPRDPASYPFYIALNYPHPSWEDGRLLVYSFHTGTKLPALPVPLGHNDSIVFDYDAAYQEVFAEGRWAKFLDYTQPPDRLHSYSAADQERIAQFMATQTGDSS
ncbi:MAG: DUF4058 family protein [Anaerolineae bacterium]|jgi:hypothetical protein|nr:DUF4058 family protein [Anaerolineae bacterium]